MHWNLRYFVVMPYRIPENGKRPLYGTRLLSLMASPMGWAGKVRIGVAQRAKFRPRDNMGRIRSLEATGTAKITVVPPHIKDGLMELGRLLQALHVWNQ